MSTWALIQVVFDIFAALGFFVIVMRMNRAPKDDPRLSRGLQLLQSKISVLEDLSDRTETQASQLSAILEQKCREVQAKVQIAEQHVHEIRVSMDRSLEVAKIFQDKIPHAEIIERQNSIKYVEAARLAHQGLSAEEISKQIDLPKGEIEFIAKINREQLMFSEDQLPQWARGEEPAAPKVDPLTAQASHSEAYQTLAHGSPYQLPSNEDLSEKFAAVNFHQPQPAAAQADNDKQHQLSSQRMPQQNQEAMKVEMELAERQRLVENLSRLQSDMHNLDIQLARETSMRDMTSAFEPPRVESGQLHKLGEEFRKACDEADIENSRSMLPPLDQLNALIPQMFMPLSADFVPSAGVDQDAVRAAPAAPGGVAGGPQPSVGGNQEFVPATEATKLHDPEFARAAAQAKVRAALNQMKPAFAIPLKEASPDLTAAKAAAQAVTATGLTVVAASPAPTAGKPAAPAGPVIRRVEFPRIDMPSKN